MQLLQEKDGVEVASLDERKEWVCTWTFNTNAMCTFTLWCAIVMCTSPAPYISVASLYGCYDKSCAITGDNVDDKTNND